jgi:hypothetical protein
LEILDSIGRPVRRFSCDDKPEAVNPKNLTIATYWLRPPQILSSEAGMHRFVWDLHYAPAEGLRSYPMTAIYGKTPSEPHGPWVMPGDYVVRLTVSGQSYSQPMTIKMDPRVKTSTDDLKLQYSTSMQCYEKMREIEGVQKQFRALRTQLQALRDKPEAKDTPGDAINSLLQKVQALDGADMMRRGRGRRPASDENRPPTLASLHGQLGALLGLLQGADAKPTTQALQAVDKTTGEWPSLMEKCRQLLDKDLVQLNEQLMKAGLPKVERK